MSLPRQFFSRIGNGINAAIDHVVNFVDHTSYAISGLATLAGSMLEQKRAPSEQFPLELKEQDFVGWLETYLVTEFDRRPSRRPTLGVRINSEREFKSPILNMPPLEEVEEEPSSLTLDQLAGIAYGYVMALHALKKRKQKPSPKKLFEAIEDARKKYEILNQFRQLNFRGYQELLESAKKNKLIVDETGKIVLCRIDIKPKDKDISEFHDYFAIEESLGYLKALNLISQKQFCLDKTYHLTAKNWYDGTAVYIFDAKKKEEREEILRRERNFLAENARQFSGIFYLSEKHIAELKAMGSQAVGDYVDDISKLEQQGITSCSSRFFVSPSRDATEAVEQKYSSPSMRNTPSMDEVD